MKVLILSKACYAAAYRRKLEEIASLGVDLTLVAPPYWRSGGRKLPLEPGYDTGYRLVVMNPVLNGSFHLHFYPRLPALLRQVRPDIVHVEEEPYDLVTYHACRAAQAAGSGTIFFTWQNIHRRYPPPFSFFQGQVLKDSLAGIAGSRDAAAVLRQKGFRRPLYVIPQFGIDPDLFPYREPDPVPTFTPERPFRIGFSGRLVEEKGLRPLLQAVKGMDGPWQLTFLGDGPFRPVLESEAAGLGIAARVAFLGSVPSDRVHDHLRSLDVVVNPSLTWERGKTRWKEQFGRSLVEAMACGVPVVGSDSGEIPHVIRDAGLIAPEGDAAALRQRLQSLMESADLRLRLARAGRERVLAGYTQRRVAEQTFAVYRQLLGETP